MYGPTVRFHVVIDNLLFNDVVMPEASQPRYGIVDINNTHELLLPMSLLKKCGEKNMPPKVTTEDPILTNLIALNQDQKLQPEETNR